MPRSPSVWFVRRNVGDVARATRRGPATPGQDTAVSLFKAGETADSPGRTKVFEKRVLVSGRIEGTGYPKSVATWRKSWTGTEHAGRKGRGKVWGSF